MLSGLLQVVGPARARGAAVGAFNVILLEHAEAVVSGAEQAGRAVVVQISENCVRHHGSLAPLLRACLALAEQAVVPVVVHLDHAEDADLVREAVRGGVSSVMVDASRLPYAENVELTRRLRMEAHEHGVQVEAELGEVGGKGGAHTPGVRTDPEQARSFVAATGVDLLAVAVGSSHAMRDRTARLDLELVGRLRDAVPVPLVLHGSSGVPDDGLTGAARSGLAKVNVGTLLNTVLTGAVRGVLDADPTVIDPRRWLAPGRDAVAAEVARLLRLLDPGADHRTEP